MPAAPRLWGILISVLCHVLIMLIPISLATKAPQLYQPVEFVMTLAEKPMASESPPRAAEPERVRPKAKIKLRPQPRPIITEPVETNTFIPQPLASASPPPASRRTIGEGTGRNTGPRVTDFGSATGPAFLRRVTPVYPEQARRLGQEGKVVLRLTIDARGNLLKVEVLERAGFGFEDSAVEAVKHSSFRPATIRGEAVASIARLAIRFILKN